MKLAFVFTNYNNSVYTIDCINTIVANIEKGNFYITVVDNNSTIEEKKKLNFLESKFENVDLIFDEDNLGYFRGLNKGIAHITQSCYNADYFIIGNNDLLFPTDFYRKMQKHQSVLNEYAVVSPNIITMDGVHQNPHVIKNISPIREFIYDLYYSNYYVSIMISLLARLTKKFTDRSDEDQYDVPQTIYQGYGACYILGPLFFKYFDLLWAPTFLMGEEFFLSYQLHEKRLKIYYEPDIIVTHHDHASVGKLPSKKFWKISRDAHQVYKKYIALYNK